MFSRSSPSAERRLLPALAPWLVLAVLPELGCFVSFDGYGPLPADSPDAGTGGATATGGASPASGGKASSSGGTGGQGAGGATSGGTSANGGAGTGGASSAGGASTGGAASNAGGSATGGTASTGGGASGGTTGSGGTPATGGVPATGGAATGGASGGTGGSAGIRCPTSLAGPALAAVPKPGGGIFCMDRTEITNEDYAAFMASDPDPAAQSSVCSWNTSFWPEAKAGVCAQVQYDPSGRPKQAVSCVDWCDAKRYCEWAGKHLCGAISGGAAMPSRFADATHSQWFAACSMGGTRAFPYGDVYRQDACVTLENSGTHAENVESLTTCRGGYPELYDMSGNVAEWEDSCNGSSGAADTCLERGGSVFSTANVVPTPLCNSSLIDDSTPSPALSRRDQRSEFIGVRCCYDP